MPDENTKNNNFEMVDLFDELERERVELWFWVIVVDVVALKIKSFCLAPLLDAAENLRVELEGVWLHFVMARVAGDYQLLVLVLRLTVLH